MADSSPTSYMYSQDAVDFERLRLASGQLNQLTSEACMRAGLGPGMRALDVGCGQLGALGVLGTLVGPSGVVVGLDANRDALDAARTSLAAMNLERTALVQADIHSVDPSAFDHWGPFDVAVCRLLLVHQRDPIATLRAVTRLMRPGGRIIAIDVLRDPGFPRYDPPIPAVNRIRELDIAHIRARGLPYDVAWEYGDVFDEAGLRLLEWRGHLSLRTTDTTFLLAVRNLLLSQATGLLAYGLATQVEIDALTAEMDDALRRPLRRSATSVFVNATGEVPN